MRKFSNPTGGTTRAFDCHNDPMFDDQIRLGKITLNGKVVDGVFRFRLGFNGYVDSYVIPISLNRARDGAKRRPRLRGVVELVPKQEVNVGAC